MAQPVLIPVPYLRDAQPYFDRLADLPSAAWFDSCGLGEFDIITACPSHLLTEADALERGKSLMDAIAIDCELPFVGGLLGFVGYGFGQQSELRNHSDLGDAQLGLYHWSLVLDHQQQQATCCFLPSCDAITKDTVITRLSAPEINLEKTFKVKDLKSNLDLESYLEAINKIQAYIHAGDCYQVNFAQRFNAAYEGNPLDAYRALRSLQPGPYSGYLSTQTGALLSFSPEQFLHLRGDKVRTKPIKGTRPRANDPATDDKLAKELLASTKDRAENLMIVDLLRNDLSKNCTPNSVRVPKLWALESYENVHHLVSTVVGEKRADCHPLDLFMDAFPGGSITGAPKKRAMEIIAELEPNKRSAYCGSLMYLSANGRMDSNIAIRTVVCDGGELHCWGGGGIVSDSQPEQEYQESLDKIQRLLVGLEQLSR